MASTPRHPLRLAFIGTGNWARTYHLPALRYICQNRLGGCELTLRGIYGLKQGEAAELAQQYGFSRIYRTLDELIQDPEVDSVAVVISPEATREVVLKLLAKNVPLFTEKPPGANYGQAQELARVVHVPNVVGFNRRYGIVNNHFREMVMQKTHGIIQIRGVMYRRNRREEHFLLHTGPHLINLIEYLFGEIRSLRNERGHEPGTGGVVYRAHIRFESGLTGEIVFSPCSERHWEGIEVKTADKTLILHSPHNDAPGEITVCRHSAGSNNEQVLARSGEHVPVLEEGYAWEHVDMLSAMSDGRPTRSTFANALNTMRVTEAIETGRDLD